MKASVDTNDALKSLATHMDSSVGYGPFGDITHLQKILPYYPIFDDHEHNKVAVYPPGFLVFHR